MIPWLTELRRRSRLLREARRALQAGRPELALERLRDPGLAASRRAARLRGRGLQSLWRGACDDLLRGRDVELGGRLAVLVAEDPERCGQLRRLLGDRPGDDRRAPSPRERGAATMGGVVVRFLIAVDDGGEVLVAAGSELVLGHSRSGQAQLPFLADVAARHARLACRASFHGGWTWSIAPVGGEPVLVGGEPVLEGRVLADGDEIELAANLRSLCRAPGGSGVLVLDLLGGAECCGAQRVLAASGDGGRIRIGGHTGCHVPVPGLEREILLRLEGDVLVAEGGDGLHLAPGSAPALPGREGELHLACPPRERVDLVLGGPRGNRPPFQVTLRPVG